MEASRKTLSAARHSSWLSELGQAIDEAQWLAWRIGVVEGRNAQALELYVRLEIVRAELEALRGRERNSLRFARGTAFCARPSDSLREVATAREGLEK